MNAERLHIQHSETGILLRQSGERYAIARVLPGARDLAWAALLASAPEMLAQYRNVLSVALESLEQDPTSTKMMFIRDTARAAIATAEGRK